MKPWPHQQRAVDETLAAIHRGERRICLTSPTGGGKSLIMCMLIETWLDAGLRVAIYTNRRMLVDQLSRVLAERGICHGVRAAGYGDDGHMPVQICSLQTEETRSRKAKQMGNVWQLHDADRVLVDEGHLHTGPTASRILKAHAEAGASYVMVTATPLDMGALCDTLIVAGTTSELRACGALVPCLHYGPDEPDLKKFKLQLGEDLSENQNRQAMMTPTIFARVFHWFERLNPEHKPTILFAPGVAESKWFAEEFTARGITAAHIDGQDVWVNGRLERSNRELRDEVLAGSKRGDIVVLCNRFVLREGIDCPWLAHGIFATVFGSLQSYLQSGGRLLRSYPGLEQVTLQDHGGNWWRHGSLNSDRDWRLEYTASIVAGLRADRLRTKKEREPARCPQCGMILLLQRCPCGYEVDRSRKSRPVVQTDGTLKEMRGDIFRPRRITNRPDGPQAWERMYHRSRQAGRTFNAAATLFAIENNWGYPDPSWPLMPVEPLDWYRRVTDVPRERLTGAMENADA